MLRRMWSIFDQTHHDNGYGNDDDDFYHDDDDDLDDDGTSHLKSMHHPPERMKGQAIKGIPPSSEETSKTQSS